MGRLLGVLVVVVVGRAELVMAGVGGGVAVPFRVGGVTRVHGAGVAVRGERGLPRLAQVIAVRLRSLLGGRRGSGRIRRVVTLPPPFPCPPFLGPHVLLRVGGSSLAVALRRVLPADV